MWSSFLSLLGHSGKAFVDAIGTTALGFVVSFGFAIASIVIALVVIYRRRGRDAMLKHWRKDAKTALLVMLICGITVYSPIFFFEIVNTVYKDHKSSTTRNKDLENSIEPLNAKIRDLQEHSIEACFAPDRRLTQEKHDLLYKLLKATAEKYHHPKIMMGYFDGDTESSRYLSSIYVLLRDAGFYMGKDIILKPQRKKSDDPPNIGTDAGMSIQIQSDTPPDSDHPRQQIAMAIFQDFSDAGVSMSQFPIGPNNQIKTSSQIVIWVGVKEVDLQSGITRQ